MTNLFVLLGVIVALALAFIGAYQLRRRISPERLEKFDLVVRELALKNKAKIVIGFYMIATRVPSTYDVSLPADVRRLLEQMTGEQWQAAFEGRDVALLLGDGLGDATMADGLSTPPRRGGPARGPPPLSDDTAPSACPTARARRAPQGDEASPLSTGRHARRHARGLPQRGDGGGPAEAAARLPRRLRRGRARRWADGLCAAPPVWLTMPRGV